MKFSFFPLAALLAAGLGFTARPADALDTLRVGVNGNVSWTGKPFGTQIIPLAPEYKVGKDFTQVGNAPGNLIALQALEGIAPAVLLKAVVETLPEQLAAQQELTKQLLLKALSQLSEVVSIDTLSEGRLVRVQVQFQAGTSLSQATQLVLQAVEPLRPVVVGSAGTGLGGETQSALDCSEEKQEFASTATVLEGWGACESGLSGTRGFVNDCYRTVCKNRATGEVSSTPGRQTGKRVALTQDDRLPTGTTLAVLPVALGPEHVAKGENVAQRALTWDGRITAPAIKDVAKDELELSLLELIQPGGEADAFARKGTRGALGSFLVLDLGSPIGVNRVRFYPRNTVQSAPGYAFQSDFLRQFELTVHDGQNLVLDGTGRLAPQLEDYQILLRSTENQEAVVDVPVSPPQLVRFVRLKATSSVPYEVDEFEVYGQGFLSSSRYISHVYDLGAPATWGNIHWQEQLVELGVGEEEVAGGEDDNCTTKSEVFKTAEDISSDWGDCETFSRFEDGVGYTTVWQCYQTACRDDRTGQLLTNPGKKSGKVVALRQVLASSAQAQVLIRTRTGSDPTPLLYKRKNVEQLETEEQFTSLKNSREQLGRDEYLKLSPNLDAAPPQVWDKGAIEDDLENWSPWSAPYRNGELAGGTPVLSPGPRRYIQFQVEFQNSRIDATKMLEGLEVEYLLPPIADDLVAEIYPREVQAFETVSFTYAVRALMDIPGVKGFDAFEVDTPSRVLGIDKIQVVEGGVEERVLAEQVLEADITLDSRGFPVVELKDGSRHPLPYQAVAANGDTFTIQSVNDKNFLVRFPLISRPAAGGERLLKIFFRGRVLLYSTLFRGQAILSSQQGALQRINPGDAGYLGQGDLPTASGITVLSPSITRGSLLGSFSLEPNPFTPNGDGVNDVLRIAYDVLALTREAQTRMQVFDLSGRLVRTLYRGGSLSGHYDGSTNAALAWDGTDAGGARVPPGIYLLRLEIEGDARDSRRTRTVAVVY
ncbi:MAG: hypothetical protein EXS58_09475 [Candidatus Latescibacteria bacterium]|nr:hypothetical protein [Candidatus Latescibacterota bacterium]